MTARIEFSTSRYEQVYGRKPRGYGLWYFCLPGGVTLSQPGVYAEAARAVAARLSSTCTAGRVRIQVCA
jgi:hypothetical protein